LGLNAFPPDQRITETGFENNRRAAFAGAIEFKSNPVDIYQLAGFREPVRVDTRCYSLVRRTGKG